jgi:hypothetical protein
MSSGRAILLAVLALLGACTMRSALDTLTSPEDRALGREMVEHLRRGDAAWLQSQFRPDLWAQSSKQINQAPALFPNVPGTTELVSFSISSSRSGEATERSKEFMLVTYGRDRWTVTRFRTFSTGGPDQVVQWSVTPHTSPPPELTLLKTWDAAVPWIWAGLTVLLLSIGALVVWLVRRSGKRRQASGTP